MNLTTHLPAKSCLFLPLFTICVLLTANAHAQERVPGYLTVTTENDIYAPRGRDRHYTNGVRLAVGFAEDQEPDWYNWIDRFSLFSGDDVSRHYEIALGQNLYTPQFFITSDPLPDDRPYAGWLYGELLATLHRPGTAEVLAINIGLVGPAALGEPVQKIMHTITGDQKPGGWDNQLGNEPALLLRYQRSWFMPLHQVDTIHASLVTSTGFSLGNVFTDVGVRAAVRIGDHLPEQDVPLRIQPGLSGGRSTVPIRNNRTDWMLFGGLQGRLVARNIFLDGNTFRDSLSVTKRRFVSDASVGLVLGFGQFRYPLSVSFTLVWRGREFDLQRDNNQFGSASISVQY